MTEVLVKHSIKTVARQTGLSPHVIRAWEKRYQTVQPTRSEGKQRLYSAADIGRLTLLRQATEAGFSIGTIASISLESLQSLLSNQLQARLLQESNLEWQISRLATELKGQIWVH